MKPVPRPLIDDFERLVVRVFSEIPAVQAVWTREVPEITGPRKYTRVFWLSFSHRSRSSYQKLEQLVREISVRYANETWGIDVHVLVDDEPAAALGPALIWHRGA